MEPRGACGLDNHLLQSARQAYRCAISRNIALIRLLLLRPRFQHSAAGLPCSSGSITSVDSGSTCGVTVCNCFESVPEPKDPIDMRAQGRMRAPPPHSMTLCTPLLSLHVCCRTFHCVHPSSRCLLLCSANHAVPVTSLPLPLSVGVTAPFSLTLRHWPHCDLLCTPLPCRWCLPAAILLVVMLAAPADASCQNLCKNIPKPGGGSLTCSITPDTYSGNRLPGKDSFTWVALLGESLASLQRLQSSV